jgi:hypothetical protein
MSPSAGERLDDVHRPRRHAVPRRGWPLLVLLGVFVAASLPAGAVATVAEAPAAPESCPPANASPQGAGGGAGTTPPLASLSVPPARIIACIGPAPITGETFDHWAVVARKSAAPGGSRAHKRLSAKARRQLVRETVVEVMNFLVSAEWVLGEAQALGLDTAPAAVRRDFDRIRRAQFPKRSEFRRFLRQSGQTVPDLLLRVRLNLDSSAIQRHVAEGKSGAAAQAALSEFVKTFRLKWRAQTACLPAYAIANCGVVESPL